MKSNFCLVRLRSAVPDVESVFFRFFMWFCGTTNMNNKCSCRIQEATSVNSIHAHTWHSFHAYCRNDVFRAVKAPDNSLQTGGNDVQTSN